MKRILSGHPTRGTCESKQIKEGEIIEITVRKVRKDGFGAFKGLSPSLLGTSWPLMNNKYLIDAYAWVEYLIGSRAGKKVKSILNAEKNEIYTCTVTVTEVVSKIAREGQDFEAAYDHPYK